MTEVRMDWDTTWMNVALSLAKRSRCISRQVGAVIVTTENRPIAVGYNGPPAGMHLDEDSSCASWCPRKMNDDQTIDYANCYTIHAEMNALLFADRRDYEGGTLYVTSSVCWDCGKVIANSGLGAVYMMLDPKRDAHRDPERTIRFLESCGIDVLINIVKE